MSQGKFVRMLLGPVHFKTKFLQFINQNADTLKNFYYAVDNIELYEPYKSLIEIHNIEDLRKDCQWSKEKEIVFGEKNVELYIKNFKSFCNDPANRRALPLLLVRFAIRDLAEKGITNICVVQNNLFFTNQQKKIDKFFESIPEGTIYLHLQGEENKLHESVIPIHLGDALKNKFPDFIIPSDAPNCEGYIFGCHFKSKEDMLLFCDICDFLVEQYACSSDNSASHWYHIWGGGFIGYTRYEDILCYAARIFQVNFGYSLRHRRHYFETHDTGVYMTTPHDKWYYYDQASITKSWGLPVAPLDDENVKTINDYSKKYKKQLQSFYNAHAVHCDYHFAEDDEIVIKYKYS